MTDNDYGKRYEWQSEEELEADNTLLFKHGIIHNRQVSIFTALKLCKKIEELKKAL